MKIMKIFDHGNLELYGVYGSILVDMCCNSMIIKCVLYTWKGAHCYTDRKLTKFCMCVTMRLKFTFIHDLLS